MGRPKKYSSREEAREAKRVQNRLSHRLSKQRQRASALLPPPVGGFTASQYQPNPPQTQVNNVTGPSSGISSNQDVPPRPQQVPSQHLQPQGQVFDSLQFVNSNSLPEEDEGVVPVDRVPPLGVLPLDGLSPSIALPSDRNTNVPSVSI